MQALAFLAVFVYATHATHAIAFEWKPGLTHAETSGGRAQCARTRVSSELMIGRLLRGGCAEMRHGVL